MSSEVHHMAWYERQENLTCICFSSFRAEPSQQAEIPKGFEISKELSGVLEMPVLWQMFDIQGYFSVHLTGIIM